MDRWDEGWTESVKRQVVKDAFYIHQHKGTTSAVRRVVEPFGFLIRIIEWWQTGEAPGTFRLDIGVQDQGITEDTYLELERLISDAKPCTPMGRFFFHVMGALAEMERELIVERTRAGLAAARAKGRVGGRRPKLTTEQWAQIGRLLEAGESRQRIALIFDVGVSTIYRKFPANKINESP